MTRFRPCRAVISRRSSSRAKCRRSFTLLVANQPTRGVDVGSIEFIHRRIVDTRDQGLRGSADFVGAGRGCVRSRTVSPSCTAVASSASSRRIRPRDVLGLMMAGVPAGRGRGRFVGSAAADRAGREGGAMSARTSRAEHAWQLPACFGVAVVCVGAGRRHRVSSSGRSSSRCRARP